MRLDIYEVSDALVKVTSVIDQTVVELLDSQKQCLSLCKECMAQDLPGEAASFRKLDLVATGGTAACRCTTELEG